MLDRLVEIFCEVDDFCKAFQDAFESHLIGHGRGSRGPDPGRAEAEIITRLLVLHNSGFN
jgi:Transposase DDE domain